MNAIQENLFILMVLAGCMISSWWGLVILINKAMGFNLRVVYETIYSNPIAAAILRVGIMYVIAELVVAAFGRYV
jgi:hypothetical protein